MAPVPRNLREKKEKYFAMRQFEGGMHANPPQQARIMPKRSKYIQYRAQNLQGGDRPQKKAKTAKENGGIPFVGDQLLKDTS